MTNSDKKYMQIAIDLAKNGAGKVSPNPMVGALIVKNGKIIGKGYHAKFGENHAEVNAIADNLVKGSTMYVTLEPCNHFGNTPPCTDRIISEEIQSVVIGSIDPDPRMQGKSIEYLKKNGIDVKVGVLRNETNELIRFYSNWKKTGYPYITIKLAISNDGFIANIDGESKWISSEQSRKEVHQMRAEYDAILVGTNTILVDNPALTVRHVTGRNPNRIIIDRTGKIDNTMNVFTDNTEKIFYFSTINRDDLPQNTYQIRLAESEFNLTTIIRIMGENEQMSILVEGGANITESLIKEKLCNEIILYQAHKSFGNGISFDKSLIDKYKFKKFDQSRIGIDNKITYRRMYV